MNSLGTLRKLNGPDIDEQAIIDLALEILERRARKPDYFISCPGDATAYVRLKLAEDPDREHFLVVYLDQRHGVIDAEVLFHGTIDGASIHPRIVLQRALALNAAAVVLAHNHPSGNPEPSAADCQITMRIQDALALADVRVLDHLVIGEGQGVYSFAEAGRI
jgi:DNA repair protein RadC